MPPGASKSAAATTTKRCAQRRYRHQRGVNCQPRKIMPGEGSVTAPTPANQSSVHAGELQLTLHGMANGCLVTVGQGDRRTVCGVQGVEVDAAR